MRNRKFTNLLALAVVAIFALTGCVDLSDFEGGNGATPPVSSRTEGDLIIAPYEHRGDYDRKLFGGWDDPDGNGCDARNDVLRRDLKDPRIDSDGCKILSGELDDPYSDLTVEFTRGRKSSQDVPIDHVLPVSYAWNAAAYNWSEEKRVEFYNDQENLLAVSNISLKDGDTKLNGWKSDMTPGQIQHCIETGERTDPNGDPMDGSCELVGVEFTGQCEVGSMFLSTAARWNIPITQRDYEVAKEWSEGC